jgi:hypothetical protein
MIRLGLLIGLLLFSNGSAQLSSVLRVTGTAQFKAGVLEFRATLKNTGKNSIIFEHSYNFTVTSGHPTCNPTMWKVTGFANSKSVWDGAVTEAFQPNPKETNPGSLRFPVSCPLVLYRTTILSNSELVIIRRYSRGQIPLNQGTYTFAVSLNLKQQNFSFQTPPIVLP